MKLLRRGRARGLEVVAKFLIYGGVLMQVLSRDGNPMVVFVCPCCSSWERESPTPRFITKIFKDPIAFRVRGLSDVKKHQTELIMLLEGKNGIENQKISPSRSQVSRFERYKQRDRG